MVIQLGGVQFGLKSCDWLLCFSVSFPLAGEKERFRAENSAIWE